MASSKWFQIISHVTQILLNPYQRARYDITGPIGDEFDLASITGYPKPYELFDIMEQEGLNESFIDILGPTAYPIPQGRISLEASVKMLKAAHANNHIGWFIEALLLLQNHPSLAHILPDTLEIPQELIKFQVFLRGIHQLVYNEMYDEPATPTLLNRIRNLANNLGNPAFLKAFDYELSSEFRMILYKHNLAEP